MEPIGRARKERGADWADAVGMTLDINQQRTGTART